MTEKQLIAKLKDFRQIRPNEDWVVFTKKQILNQDKKSFLEIFFQGERFIFHHKPAFAFALSLAILIGLFGFAQNSVPGDTLFRLKKITEQGTAVFVSEKDQAKHNLELANKRLDDLFKITQENEVNSLGPAINEYQETISKAAKSLAQAEPKEIVEQVKKIEEKTEKIKSLGIEIGENDELENALAKLLEREIGELENNSLTEDQEISLDNIKEEYKAGNYSQALESLILAF